MPKINEQHLLDEIRFDIEVKDLLKAKLVLESLEHVERSTQKQALYEVSQAADDFSIPLLAGVIAHSPNISESFPQLKETMFSKILDSPEVLLDLLTKMEDPVIRAFLVEIAGEIPLPKAAPILIDTLIREQELKIIKSAISSLGMIGDPSATDVVSKYLDSNDREIVNLSVRALGELASLVAIQKLSEKLGENPDLDLMILDTIGKMQNPEALAKLNEMLESPLTHIRTVAKKKLSEIGTLSIRFLINNLERDDPDLVIHSLNVLGDIGDIAAIGAIRNLLFNEPEDANVRFAAYETLGRLPFDKGALALAAGLEDTVNDVRSAAAKAIDRHYNLVLAGGVRNMIRSGDAQALSIMWTIINSQCENIFLDLLEEDTFKTTAMKYLSNKAHPDIQSYFVKILTEAGYHDLANQISPKKPTEKKGTLKVFAIDDSKMVLNIYRPMLHNLGYTSQLFELPSVALESIQKIKPDVILTDLNMPDITGIDLAKKVRQRYNKQELPIIMVTTQNEAHCAKDAYAVGVNSIMRKPFTEKIIQKMITACAGIPPSF